MDPGVSILNLSTSKKVLSLLSSITSLYFNAGVPLEPTLQPYDSSIGCKSHRVVGKSTGKC